MKNLNFFLALFLSAVLFSCNQKNEGVQVIFPKISEPIQITANGKEHLFASYYGINSFSQSQQYVTVLETDIKSRLPEENDPAVLGLVDVNTKEFIPIAETRAWNFQQGCMAHWLEPPRIP